MQIFLYLFTFSVCNATKKCDIVMNDFEIYFSCVERFTNDYNANDIEFINFYKTLDQRYKCIFDDKVRKVYFDKIFNLYLTVIKYANYEDYTNEKFKMLNRHKSIAKVHAVYRRNIILKAYVISIHDKDNLCNLKNTNITEIETIKFAKSMFKAIRFLHKNWYACGFLDFSNIYIQENKRIVLASLLNLKKLEHASLFFMQKKVDYENTIDMKNRDYFYACNIMYFMLYKDEFVYKFITLSKELFTDRTENAKILSDHIIQNELGNFLVDYVAGNVKHKVKHKDMIKMIQNIDK